MKILYAEIINLLSGPDYVYLQTDLDSPFPQYPGDKLRLEFKAPRGHGRDYLDQHFPGIPIERDG